MSEFPSRRTLRPDSHLKIGKLGKKMEFGEGQVFTCVPQAGSVGAKLALAIVDIMSEHLLIYLCVFSGSPTHFSD